MTTRWSLTFDCADAQAMARFWTIALGYVEQAPPEGWETWEEWLRHFDVPEDEWGDGASLADPAGILPTVSFLRVPEAKTAKNRLHLDLQVAGGRHVDADERTARIEAKVAELVAAGAAADFRALQDDGALDHVVMLDPEGNEFCVV
jgi:catechol 2,3-dioxygenase-like lactoylglutathione lyase family enzyme